MTGVRWGASICLIGVWLAVAVTASAAPPQPRIGLSCATEAAGVDWLRRTLVECPDDHEGTWPLPWTLYPEEPPPGPDARSILVAVHEQACASARNPIPHLDDPEVKYLKRAVVIELWIHPPEGAQLCPGNPIGRLRVHLPGPLGERKLYDGSSDPPRRVKPGEDPRRLRLR
jgi:hypothetical protein